MEKENIFSDPDVSEGLKAFAVSLYRMAIRNPRLLLYLAEADKDATHVGRWKSLYDDFQIPESKESFLRALTRAVSGHDWTKIEQSYRDWGKFGWITDHDIHSIDFWD